MIVLIILIASPSLTCILTLILVNVLICNAPILPLFVVDFADSDIGLALLSYALTDTP